MEVSFYIYLPFKLKKKAFFFLKEGALFLCKAILKSRQLGHNAHFFSCELSGDSSEDREERVQVGQGEHLSKCLVISCQCMHGGNRGTPGKWSMAGVG